MGSDFPTEPRGPILPPPPQQLRSTGVPVWRVNFSDDQSNYPTIEAQVLCIGHGVPSSGLTVSWVRGQKSSPCWSWTKLVPQLGCGQLLSIQIGRAPWSSQDWCQPKLGCSHSPGQPMPHQPSRLEKFFSTFWPKSYSILSISYKVTLLD